MEKIKLVCMGRRILITSGKGGVGKTTITAALGMSLAKLGESVVVVEGDVGLNNLDTVMNIEDKIVCDLDDYLTGKCRLKQCLIPDKTFSNLYTLPALKKGDSGKYLETYEDLILKLSKVFNYCLIDCPAGVENSFLRALSGANEAIVVVTPHLSSIRDADKVLSILDGAGKCVAGIVVNRIRGDLVASKKMLSHEEIEKLLCRRILACIPESDAINIYSHCGMEKVILGEEGTIFNLMANALHNGSGEKYDYLTKYRGVLGGIRRLLKRKV